MTDDTNVYKFDTRDDAHQAIGEARDSLDSLGDMVEEEDDNDNDYESALSEAKNAAAKLAAVIAWLETKV